MRIIHFLQLQGPLAGDHLQHVFDLAQAMTRARGAFALVCTIKEARADVLKRLDQLEKQCPLGVLRLDMAAQISANRLANDLSDGFVALRQASQFALDLKPDLLHGHGSTGGAIARLVRADLKRRKSDVPCLYSPGEDGFGTGVGLGTESWAARQFEKRLQGLTSGLVFASDKDKSSWQDAFGKPSCPTRVIARGLSSKEFEPRQIVDMASDFLFVGALDRKSGVDILVQALARLEKDRLTGALIAGSGRREKDLRRQVERYGLTSEVFFNPPMPARLAFLKGNCLVLPLRKAPAPAIVLQAAAAGVPMILTRPASLDQRLGSEITNGMDLPLVAENDVDALLLQMRAFLDDPAPFLERADALRRKMISILSLERMAGDLQPFCAKLANQG